MITGLPMEGDVDLGTRVVRVLLGEEIRGAVRVVRLEVIVVEVVVGANLGLYSVCAYTSSLY